MKEIFELIFRSFWTFLGSVVLTSLVWGGALNFVFRCWNRFFRHRNINKHGWPPPHCDADGDYKE